LRDFAALFGRPPLVRASAPGRVNLVGEHTDYNGGFVLPIAIPLRTHVEIAPHGGDAVVAWSASLPAEPVSFRIGAEARTGGWIDYVQGVTRALVDAGHCVGAFDLRVESDVPVGSGLSSSAALEVALLRGLRDTFGLALDDPSIARIGQRAENDFVGAPVGIMDQMAASLASERAALFLDTRDLAWRSVPLPAGVALAVIDSGITHAHASGEYRARRAECERAAAALRVRLLREVGPTDLPRIAALPPPLDRRARHVVTENERVLAAVAALDAGDVRAFGALLSASHVSMRDDFEVSLPVIDRLVAVCDAEAGVFGTRLTGGGFGGCVVLLAEAGRARDAATDAAARWAAETGGTPRVRIPP
jgi:galactokinase